MEGPARIAIERKMARIRVSNVDPAELSGLLLARGIIGTNDVQRASFEGKLAPERRGELFLTIMGNGTPGIFQALVEILLCRQEWKWLGTELQGNVGRGNSVRWVTPYTSSRVSLERSSR